MDFQIYSKQIPPVLGLIVVASIRAGAGRYRREKTDLTFCWQWHGESSRKLGGAVGLQRWNSKFCATMRAHGVSTPPSSSSGHRPTTFPLPITWLAVIHDAGYDLPFEDRKEIVPDCHETVSACMTKEKRGWREGGIMGGTPIPMSPQD